MNLKKAWFAIFLGLFVKAAMGQSAPILEIDKSEVVFGEPIRLKHYWPEENGKEIAFYSYTALPVGFFHRRLGKIVPLRKSETSAVGFADLYTRLGSPGVPLTPIGREQVGSIDGAKTDVVGVFLIYVEYTTRGKESVAYKSNPILLTVNPLRTNGQIDSDFLKAGKLVIDKDMQEYYEKTYDTAFDTK